MGPHPEGGPGHSPRWPLGQGRTGAGSGAQGQSLAWLAALSPALPGTKAKVPARLPGRRAGAWGGLQSQDNPRPRQEGGRGRGHDTPAIWAHGLPGRLRRVLTTVAEANSSREGLVGGTVRCAPAAAISPGPGSSPDRRDRADGYIPIMPTRAAGADPFPCVPHGLPTVYGGQEVGSRFGEPHELQCCICAPRALSGKLKSKAALGPALQVRAPPTGSDGQLAQSSWGALRPHPLPRALRPSPGCADRLQGQGAAGHIGVCPPRSPLQSQQQPNHPHALPRPHPSPGPPPPRAPPLHAGRWTVRAPVAALGSAPRSGFLAGSCTQKGLWGRCPLRPFPCTLGPAS